MNTELQSQTVNEQHRGNIDREWLKFDRIIYDYARFPETFHRVALYQGQISVVIWVLAANLVRFFNSVIGGVLATA